MKLPRRRFLHLAAGVAALPFTPCVARAQAYPTRPVRLISGFPPGGPNEFIARPMAQWLSERLGQPFVIENRPGAGGNVGTEAVVRAAADGYTLLFVAAANAINASVYEKLNFNFIRDIAPIGGISRESYVVLVHPLIPAKTIAEFIAYAKANPGKVNMASGGNGTPSHVAGELFKMLAGVDMAHVPYRGVAPALTDLLGGQVQVCFAPMSIATGHIRSGKLRALAVTAATRSAVLPDLPTVGDDVPGYEASAFYGVGAPRLTAIEIVDKLNKEINAALTDSNIKERLGSLGGMVLPGSPADFGKLIAFETEKWGKVVKFAGIKAE